MTRCIRLGCYPFARIENTNLVTGSCVLRRWCCTPINTQVATNSKVSFSPGIIFLNFMLMCCITTRTMKETKPTKLQAGRTSSTGGHEAFWMFCLTGYGRYRQAALPNRYSVGDMLEDDSGSNTALSTKVKRCANYIYRKPSNRKRLTRYRGMIIANEFYKTVRSGHLSAEQWSCTVHFSCTQSSRNLEEITNKVVSDLLAEFKILVMF